MIKSMTGFASEEYSHKSLSVTCDIKTINHRFLDVSIRSHELPNDVDVFIRELVSKKQVSAEIGVSFDVDVDIEADFGNAPNSFNLFWFS